MHAGTTDLMYRPFKKLNPQPLCNSQHNQIAHPIEIPEGKESSPACMCISLLYIVSSLKLEMVSFHLCEGTSSPCISLEMVAWIVSLWRFVDGQLYSWLSDNLEKPEHFSCHTCVIQISFI